jgi:hypothetical protein
VSCNQTCVGSYHCQASCATASTIIVSSQERSRRRHVLPSPIFDILAELYTRSTHRYTQGVHTAIHKEYTPLYLARTSILLRPSDVEQYLSVFYPSTDPSGQSTPKTTATPGTSLLSNIHGNLHIDCRHDPVLDLMPFFSS